MSLFPSLTAQTSVVLGTVHTSICIGMHAIAGNLAPPLPPHTQLPMLAVQFASNKRSGKELILLYIYIGVQHTVGDGGGEGWGEMETRHIHTATYFSALPPRSLSPAWFCSTQWLAPQSCTHFCMIYIVKKC